MCPAAGRFRPASSVSLLCLVRFLASFLVVCSTVASLAPAASAEVTMRSEEITAALDLSPEGTVHLWDMSPDGAYAVLIADPPGDGRRDLYSVPLAGGDPVLLRPAEGPAAGVVSFRIAAGSQIVVFATGVLESGSWRQNALYAVPMAGGTPVRVSSSAMSASHTIYSYEVAPGPMEDAARRVAYIADHETPDTRELFSAPIAGGDSVKLAGAAGSCPACRISHRFSPNGLAVVYTRETDVTTPSLHATLADGSITPVLFSPGATHAWAVTPNSAGVVYCRETAPGAYGLFAAAFTAPGSPIAISDTSAAPIPFAITPNSQGVVYLMTGPDNAWTALYSAWTATGLGDDAPISGEPLPGTHATGALITPNSLGVVFLAQRTADGAWALYGAPITGGVPVRLGDPGVDGGHYHAYQVTPNSAGVVYTSHGESGPLRLYAAAVAGGAPVVLSAHPDPEGYAPNWVVSPNSQTVVYTWVPGTDGMATMYVVPTTGGPALRVAALWPSSVDTFPVGQAGAIITPDSEGVLYAADPGGAGYYRLFLARGIEHRTYLPSLLRDTP